MCKRAKEKHLKQTRSSATNFNNPETLTRSKTCPYDRDACFFCDGAARNYQDPLHEVRTENAGISLRNAIDQKGDQKLKVKLATAIDSCDAHAVDIKYHKCCWLYNVSNVLRKPKEDEEMAFNEKTKTAAAKIEFLTMVERALENGEDLNTALLHKAYEDILSFNNVTNSTSSRKMVKRLILNEVPGVEFHKPARVNESEKVTIKKLRDKAVTDASSRDSNPDEDLQKVFDAAAILRNAIKRSEVWNFNGSLHSITEKNLPNELYSFFRWVIVGPRSVISEGEKEFEVHRRATSLSQYTVRMYLSDGQRKNKKSEKLKSSREMPQQLAVGLAVHQAVRSKKIVNILNGFVM